MCGIAGSVTRGRGEDGGVVPAMVRAISHRGPDGSGVERFDLGEGLRVSLGHARLSIFDPSPAGAQPMRKGDLAVALNGAIVNHPEIRRTLEAAGTSFRSRSDTEVLLEAWRAKGSGALADLVGMFAFAVADLRRGEVVLVRDRLGEKPLYVAEVPGAILFASELAAIEAHPAFRREIDSGALRAYLALGWVPGPRTIYRGVAKVPPGTFVRIGPGGAGEPEPYWSPPTPLREAEPDPGGARDDALEESLSESVRLRLRADVPVGLFLSGGIDSSLVAALAREAGGATPTTFAFTGPGDSQDESRHARRVAAHLGADHLEVSLRPGEILGAAEDVLDRGIDEPNADYSSIPTTFLARRASETVRVVLTGDGGDELFGGYDRYRAQRWIPRVRPAPLRALAAAAVAAAGTRRSLALARALRAEGPVERALAFTGGFTSTEIVALAGAGPVPLGEFGRIHEGEGDAVEKAMRADLRSYLVDDLLVKVDRATMRHGLEARAPFLDHRVVEAAARCGLGRPKAPLRRLLARRFPGSWFERPKKGFTVPLSRWLREELRPLVERVLDPRRSEGGGALSLRAASRIVRHHLHGRIERPAALWSLLVFERWRERTGAFREEAREDARGSRRV